MLPRDEPPTSHPGRRRPLAITLLQRSLVRADIDVQAARDDLCTGLIRWQDGGAVRTAMLELEALANDQVLPLVDEVKRRVDRMGLSILWEGREIAIHDLQVFEDVHVSFRCDPDVVREMAEMLG